MIDTNQRVVFLAENHSGAAAWYHPAYQAITEETPYTFSKVDAYGPLLHRLQECARVRNHMPNLVAVNFYRRGDLFRAVDTLNGIE